MKTYIICLIVSVLPACGWGQNCKMKTDEFRKDTTIECDKEKIGKAPAPLGIGSFPLEAMMYKFQKVESVFVLVLIPHFYSIESFDKGDIVYIKFKDGDILKLEVEEYNVGDHPGNDWYNFLSFTLNDNDVSELESKPIEKIRCGTSDYEIKDSKVNTLKEQIECIKLTNGVGQGKKKKAKDDLYGN